MEKINSQILLFFDKFGKTFSNQFWNFLKNLAKNNKIISYSVVPIYLLLNDTQHFKQLFLCINSFFNLFSKL